MVFIFAYILVYIFSPRFCRKLRLVCRRCCCCFCCCERAEPRPSERERGGVTTATARAR